MKSMLKTAWAVVLLSAGLSLAAPKPAIVQGPLLWTAEATFEHLQQIVYQPTEQSKPRRFWYLILTVNNNTGRDVEFYPQCDLMTESFQILPAGKRVPQEIFEIVATLYRDKYPLLESLATADNRILQGEDNARDIALIWSDFDSAAKNIKLFITGLSNETAVVNAPGAGDTSQKVYLRKTLELSYHLKGDAAWRSNSDIAYQGHQWVMR